MKAVEYFDKYGAIIFDEASHGKTDALLDMFNEMYLEIDQICKTRNVTLVSGQISVVKELNTKWNKVRTLFTKKYTASPLKPDAIQNYYIKHHPETEGYFIRNKPPEKFEPSEAQKEWDKMSPTSKFLVSLAMMGAMARGEMDIN